MTILWHKLFNFKRRSNRNEILTWLIDIVSFICQHTHVNITNYQKKNSLVHVLWETIKYVCYKNKWKYKYLLYQYIMKIIKIKKTKNTTLSEQSKNSIPKKCRKWHNRYPSYTNSWLHTFLAWYRHFNQIWRSKTFPGLIQALQSNLAE
jgi:hypothetical protein